MRWRTFLPWNALGGICWSASISGTAYLIGHATGGVFAAIGSALGAVVLLAVAHRLRRPRRNGATL